MDNFSHENFGNVTAPYQKTTLKQFLDNGQIEEAKAYMVKYFALCGKKIFFYDFFHKYVDVYTFAEFKETRCPKEFKCPVVVGSKVEQFVIQSWFLNEFGRDCATTVQVNKPLAFTENGVHYINLFKGFMHKVKPEAFTDFQKTGVQKIWRHIHDVWASENATIFAYLRNWISHMVAGKKMKTCLYLKSGQGTGKSIITEFLQHMVLGQDIVHVTKDIKCISGSFNGELQSKVLLILEELPVENKGEWNKLANDLKVYITNASIRIEQKMKDAIEVPNILNIILMSNNNSLRVDSDDRRTVMLDVSNKYKGNHEYFDTLLQYTLDEEVGNAFYFDCLTHAQANANFKEQIIPQTQSKQDVIVENLHTLYDFIKFCFIQHKQGIDMPFSDFYDQYSGYCSTSATKLHVDSKIRVSKLLADISIDIVRKTNNVRYVEVDAKTLRGIFLKKNWIHSLDWDGALEDGVEEVKQAEPVKSVLSHLQRAETVTKKTKARAVAVGKSLDLADISDSVGLIIQEI